MTDRHSYLGNYARTDKAWQPLTSPATIIRAYATIQAICNGKETSIPLLQSVLSLSAHPEALHLLTDRSLIEGCIQYLDQQRKADSRYVSPIPSGAIRLNDLVALWLRTRVSIFQNRRVGRRSFRLIEEQENVQRYN